MSASRPELFCQVVLGVANGFNMDFHGLEIAPKIKLVRNVSCCCGRCVEAVE